MVSYLAYGSNLWRPRLEERVRAVAVCGTASIAGYDLRFHKRGGDGSGKCDAFHTGRARDRLWGAVYVLDEAQAAVLDGFEGPGYRRVEIVVDGGRGPMHVHTYVARRSHVDARLAPFDWYKVLVVEGARKHALPCDYRARIEALAAIVDTDAARRRRNAASLSRAW